MQSGTHDGTKGSDSAHSAAPKSRARAKKPSGESDQPLSLSAKRTASKAVKAKQPGGVAATTLATTPFGDTNGLIARAAYFLAEQRHFAPGHELEDWLNAESQIKALSETVS